MAPIVTVDEAGMSKTGCHVSSSRHDSQTGTTAETVLFRNCLWQPLTEHDAFFLQASLHIETDHSQAQATFGHVSHT
jgi:hypothetical protein